MFAFLIRKISNNFKVKFTVTNYWDQKAFINEAIKVFLTESISENILKPVCFDVSGHGKPTRLRTGFQ